VTDASDGRSRPFRTAAGHGGDLLIRLPAVVAAAVLVLAALGCDGGHRGADLSVRIVNGYGSGEKDRRFSLRCDPTGGDLPNRAAVCQMIAKTSAVPTTVSAATTASISAVPLRIKNHLLSPLTPAVVFTHSMYRKTNRAAGLG
jgi:hypothetical protein